LDIEYEYDSGYLSPKLDHMDILVDVNKGGQVLRNLVSNALKFTKPGGKVTVTSTLVYVESEDPQYAEDVKMIPMLRVSVQDNGVGLSLENQSHLFKEIIQFNADKLQNGNGSGLGLWSKLNLIEVNF
jgi:signal transduction histidine kinase